MFPWNSLFWLIVTLLLLLALNRWISAHIQGVGLLLSNSASAAVWFYFLLFLPGILLHEVSHYLTALLLRVKVGKFSLWPQMKRGGNLVLGSVQVKNVDPVRHSLVGAAPIIFGSIAIIIIGRFLHFDLMGDWLFRGDLTHTLDILSESITMPDFWLWLYLLFAITNAMMPSESDRAYWVPVLGFLGVVVIGALGLGIINSIPDALQTRSADFVQFMASALGIAVIVDVIFAMVIFALEATLNIATNRKVQY